MENTENKPTLEAKAKKVMYALIGVVVVLAIVLTYTLIQNNSIVNSLEGEKAELTIQLLDLQQEYDGLSSDNAALNAQLDTSRAEVAALIERLKKTEATNRSKMRQYEKELGTLRSIMRNYIVQIDSLNTLNHKLTADAAAARKEAAEARRANKELSRKVDNLSDRVAAGSIIKARGLHAEAVNKSDKPTNRSSRVKRLVTTLSLVENELAPRGPVRVYLRIKDPQGLVLTNASSTSFQLGEDMIIASASREVDYEGKEVEMTIYLNDISVFSKGTYTIEAFTEKAALGETTLTLK